MNQMGCKQFMLDHMEAFKDDLGALIAIPSVMPDQEKCVEALRYVLDLAQRFGFKTRTTTDGRVGVVTYGAGEETLGVLAHVDVVAAQAAEWRFPPFALTEDDGRLYGRGVMDDKGPVLMVLYALRYLQEVGITGNKEIQLVVGTQEETEWSDIDAYRAEMAPPDYGFTPDGDFPISNAEKGYIDVILSFETHTVTAISGGNAPNTVPSLMSVTAEGRTHTFKGKAAHSSMPEHGDNAIVKGAVALCETIDEPVFRFLKDMFAGDHHGLRLGLCAEKELSGDRARLTTAAPTIIEMQNGRIALTINVRTAPDKTNDDIRRAFAKAGETYGFSVGERKGAKEPIYVDPQQGWLQLMKKTYDQCMGGDADFVLAQGTTYAKALPNFVSFGPLFPDEADSAHQANEYLSIDNIIKGCEIYAAYMEAVLLGAE